jgi:imidazolonepropionase-like amidohydrolase
MQSSCRNHTRSFSKIEQLASRLLPEEVVAALTRNAAAYLKREAEIGTLEPGKLADIVLVSGDPLADAMNLAQIALVVQGGTVVADRRR